MGGAGGRGPADQRRREDCSSTEQAGISRGLTLTERRSWDAQIREKGCWFDRLGKRVFWAGVVGRRRF